MGNMRYETFSSLDRLVDSIALIECFLAYKKTNKSRVFQKSVKSFQGAENFVNRTVQQETYNEEITSLSSGEPIPRNSSILALNPYLDNDGIVRVGGRLRHPKNTFCKNPILIPGKHYSANLLIRRCHELIQHQGRHITEGKVSSMGFWLTGYKRLTSSLCS